MKMQGYNGSQLWDTAFAVQARPLLCMDWLRICGLFCAGSRGRQQARCLLTTEDELPARA